MKTSFPDAKFASTWSEDRLMMLIEGQIEENALLEYKRAAALDRSNQKKKTEITKDISSFANSAGGILIYGIAEGEGDQAHLPISIDPVDRREYKKEWLEQIISAIQPPIEGIVIHSITLGLNNNAVCYAVEIPASTTAHQADDQKYYRRGNFMAEPMKDYEIRMVMNRAQHPVLALEVGLSRGQLIHLHITVSNIGRRLAKQFMLEVCLPSELCKAGYFFNHEQSEVVPNGNELIKLPFSINPKPIFPGSSRLLKIDIGAHYFPLPKANGIPVICKLFADEMPFIEKSIFIDAATP